jgi:hypothetical protein
MRAMAGQHDGCVRLLEEGCGGSVRLVCLQISKEHLMGYLMVKRLCNIRGVRQDFYRAGGESAWRLEFVPNK